MTGQLSAESLRRPAGPCAGCHAVVPAAAGADAAAALPEDAAVPVVPAVVMTMGRLVLPSEHLGLDLHASKHNIREVSGNVRVRHSPLEMARM